MRKTIARGGLGQGLGRGVAGGGKLIKLDIKKILWELRASKADRVLHLIYDKTLFTGKPWEPV